MLKTVDKLLKTPYWIIDILPKQVPMYSAGQYFAVEKYFLGKPHIEKIKQKHVNLILKLNCYYDISLDEDGEPNPEPEVIADAIFIRYVNIMIGDSMIISEPDDTHMTIFNPDEQLLSLVESIASAEGLFVWKI